MKVKIRRWLVLSILAVSSAAAAADMAAIKTRVERFDAPDDRVIEVFRFALAGEDSDEFKGYALGICKAALLDQDAMTQQYALRVLRTLSGMGVGEALPLMIEGMSDKDSAVRLKTMRELGYAGDASVLSALAEAACSVNAEERETALASLKRLPGADIEKAMLDMVADEGEMPEIRVALIKALAARGAVGAVPALLEAARGRDREVRLAALDAVGKLAGIEACVSLLEAVKAGADDAERLAAADALAAVIRRAGAPEAEVERIISACEAAEPEAAGALACALAAIGGAKAVALVEERLYDESGDKQKKDEFRIDVFERLGGAGDADALRLLGQCYDDMALGVFDDALHQEAETAYMDCALAVAKSEPGAAGAALRKIQETSADKDMAKRAQTAIDTIWLLQGPVPVRDGIVQPNKPLGETVRKGLDWMRGWQADKDYVPGKLDDEHLPGYMRGAELSVTSGAGGGRDRTYAAGHQCFFIEAFLRAYMYFGEEEWLLRARDMADWNIAHSTPADWVYGNIPFSTWEWRVDMMDRAQRKEGPGLKWADRDGIEIDKTGLMGSAYLAFYQATGDGKYLDAAVKLADTLARHQRPAGDWPFRVVPETGEPMMDNVGAGVTDGGLISGMVCIAGFFEDLMRETGPKPEYERAHDMAVHWMIKNPILKNHWSNFHEDIPTIDSITKRVSMPMSLTMRYLLAHAKDTPGYLELARDIREAFDWDFVHTENHPFAPAPGVVEQGAGRDRPGCGIMPVHTGLYCLVLCDYFGLAPSETDRRVAISGINSITWAQSPPGGLATWLATPGGNDPVFKDFQDYLEKHVWRRETWHSIHIISLGFILEAMGYFPELAPVGENHILACTTWPRSVLYAKDSVKYEVSHPAQTRLKLSFAPGAVKVNGKDLPRRDSPAQGGLGWTFDSATGVMDVSHDAGKVEISGE